MTSLTLYYSLKRFAPLENILPAAGKGLCDNLDNVNCNILMPPLHEKPCYPSATIVSLA